MPVKTPDPLKKIIIKDNIESRILLIRGHRVIIDADLAELYDVITKRLNEQVKRNINRFPCDFMFQMTDKEKSEVVANCDHLKTLKFSKSLPFAFTKHGAIMAANVLNSKKAVEMSVFVVRAFVNIREVISVNKEFTKKLTELEQKIGNQDDAIKSIIQAILGLMKQNEKIKLNKIGFERDNKSNTK